MDYMHAWKLIKYLLTKGQIAEQFTLSTKLLVHQPSEK